MRKIKLFLSLLMVMLLSVGNVWADEQLAYTLAPATGSNNSYAGNCDVTISGITWNVTGNASLTPWRLGGKSLSGVDREVYSKTAMSDAIKKVELTVGAASSITVNSLKLIVASNADFSTVVDEISKTFAANSTITFIPTSPATEWAKDAYYKFVFNVSVSGTSNKFVAFSEAKFYTETSSGGDPDPSVSADPTEVENVVAAGAENETIDLTYANITSYTTSVSVHPNADGTGTLSPAWLSASVSDADDYATVTYSVSANDGAARTAYIKVYTTDGDKEATTIIPVSQAKYSAPTGTFEPFSGDIEEGDYLIVADGAGMNTTVSGNRLQYTALTLTGENYVDPDESVIWHIAESATAGYWTIYSGAESKYAAATSSNNQAQMLESGTDNKSLWEITHSEAVYTIKNKSNSRFLKKNETYGFGCYSAGTVSLYKKQVAGQPKAPTFSVEGGNYESALSVELSCVTEGATIYYTTNGDAPTSSSTQYNGTAITVDHTMTIKAIAIKNEISSTVASATYTIIVWQTVADVWDDIVVDGPKNAHVYGYVSQTKVGGYDNNFYISDNGSTEGNQLYAYRMNMNSFSVAVGDKVKLAGDLTNYQGTKEFEYANSGATQGLVVALEAKGAVTSVAVSGNATKTTYSANETFETAGLVVTATYANGFSEVVTEGITWGDDLTDHKVTESTTVQVTATVGGVISAAYGVTIEVSTKALLSIALSADEFEVYQGLELPKPTVTATYSEGDPEDVTALAEFTGYNKNTLGEQTITVSYSFGTGDPIEETYTVTVKPIYNVELAASVARDLIINSVGSAGSGANEMIIRGIVVNPSNPSNSKQTYYISDDGSNTNTVEIFKGLYIDGANFTANNKLIAGDEVVVKGAVTYYKSSTPEFSEGSILQSLARTPNFEIEAVTGFEVGTADLAVADLTITQDGEGEVTLASSDKEEFVTIEGGKLHAVAPGTATITANLTADGIYKAATYEFSVTVIPAQVKYAITFDSNGADGGDAPEAIENKAAEAEVTLPANAYTKTGHTFDGWKVFYVDGESVEHEVTISENAFTMPAFAVTIQAQWAEISVWATTYTSNVTLTANTTNKCYDEGVTINSTDYSGLRIATGSAAGSATVTVPAHATKLHFHVAGWKGVSGSIDVKLGETTLATITLIADDGINQSNNNTAPYTLENDPIGYYYSVNIPDSESPTDIEFSAASGKRAVIFGVNQEGGIVPELQSIEIAGDLTTKSYKAGDALDLDGLTVNAIYSLGGTPQTPVDITDDAELEWSYAPLVENQTSITITATYKGQTDDITINDLVVTSADPVIYVQPSLNVNFGTVAKDASVDAKQITITLQNVAAATATLGGTNPEAFSIDDTEIADGDVITISVASTATLGNYSATITITDNEGLAPQKVVNLSLNVEDVETAVSTTSKWVAAEAADLVDGAEVLITGVKESATYAMGAQNTNNRAAVEASVDGEGVLTPGEGTMSFILVAQGDGTFALRTSNGKYLYAASSSSNHLKTQAEVTNDAKWTLTATSAIANGDNTNETVRFNSGNNPKIFSCYADESKQSAIAFYVPYVEPTPEPVYETVRENLTPNRYYTVCLPKKMMEVRGASFWTLSKRNTTETEAYLEEVDPTTAEAGTPFIIQATDTKLEVVYTGAATTTAGTNGALHGTLTYMDADALAAAGTNIYMLYNNALRPLGTNNHLDANRAYIAYNELNPVTEAPQPAPGRRVRAVPMQAQVATGVENVQGENAQCTKVMIDGQLYIMYNGTMYNVQGQLVK